DKIEELGAKSVTIETHGDASEQTAPERPEGASENTHADIALSITGIAGPNGGTPEIPVGLVYMEIALQNRKTVTFKNNFSGDRASIRQQTMETALEKLIELIDIKVA